MADSLAWIDFSMCEAVEDGEVVTGAENASPDGALRRSQSPRQRPRRVKKRELVGRKIKRCAMPVARCKL